MINIPILVFNVIEDINMLKNVIWNEKSFDLCVIGELMDKTQATHKGEPESPLY